MQTDTLAKQRGRQIGIRQDIPGRPLQATWIISLPLVCPVSVCARLKETEQLKGEHIYLTVYECIVVSIKLFPLQSLGGETPAQTILSTITCSHSYTTDFNPLIYRDTRIYASSNLGSYPLKIKCRFPPQRSHSFNPPFPFVSSCLCHQLLAFPQMGTLKFVHKTRRLKWKIRAGYTRSLANERRHREPRFHLQAKAFCSAVHKLKNSLTNITTQETNLHLVLAKCEGGGNCQEENWGVKWSKFNKRKLDVTAC